MIAKKLFTGLMLLFSLSLVSLAQDIENQFQARIGSEFQLKLIDKLKLELEPELRLRDNLSVNRFLMKTGLSYSICPFLSVGGGYRLIINNKQNKPTEYLSRYQFDASYKPKLGRFSPSLRARYTDFTEDIEDGKTMRYRAKLKYRIKKSAFTPHASYELFHGLQNSEIYKTRFAAGGDYKIAKRQSIGLEYKFDYFRTDYLNRHILQIGYKLKL